MVVKIRVLGGKSEWGRKETTALGIWNSRKNNGISHTRDLEEIGTSRAHMWDLRKRNLLVRRREMVVNGA